MTQALGDLIDGAFLSPEGEPLISRDPATGADGHARVVFETAWRAERVDAACAAAAAAASGWQDLARAERGAALDRFRAALKERRDALADALVRETGRVAADAIAEVDALFSTFDATESALAADLTTGPVPQKEGVRVRPLGVLGIVGPADRPLLLCHRHVVPALLLGDTVVVKPSPVAPLAAQIYAEAAHAALPAGIFNLVQGEAAAGRALAAHPALGGLCATVTRETAASIRLAGNDRPQLPLHLMIGGRNPAVVLDDANLRQTVHGLVLGGYGATGFRCLAFQHVLVHRDRADALVEALAALLDALQFGDPTAQESFAGPLPTDLARERFDAALAAAESAAEARLQGGRTRDSSFHRPSLHRLTDASTQVPGYTDVEVLGPDLCIAPFEDDAALASALSRLAPSPSAAVFTTDRRRFEAVRRRLEADAVSWNRAPHPVSPRLPAGGALDHRHVAVPMSVSLALPGELRPEAGLAAQLPPPDLDGLETRHVHEETEEAGRDLLSAGGRPLAVIRPPGGHLPASESWLARLYADERVVREKKPPVFDHLRSFGPFYVSVDESPLSVLDGMSQTATLPGGFAADAVVRAYVEGGFGETIVSNPDTSVEIEPEAWAFADRLRALLPNLPHVAFTGSGAEANEKALALCRLAAPNEGATKVLAFEGGFHGRTLLTLHATANPAKRAPYEIAGYEATFAPYPVWPTPMEPEPTVPVGYLEAAAQGDLPSLHAIAVKARSDLLAAEARALETVHGALSGGEHFACIVEPMQSEGGDRYATARFHKALRLLTRHHGVPLIYDEVQCGFGLGGPFAWHSLFGIIDEGGTPDGPDAVTFAKRAQVGVCMSRFEDPEPGAAHLASIVRGRLHLDVIADPGLAKEMTEWVRPRLLDLAKRYPQLVKNPRARGYALAFDLPTPQHLAAYLGQRFWRGAIVFGAGDRTVRYRLNTSWEKRDLERLFLAIRRSLSWLDANPNKPAPVWEDPAPEPKAGAKSEAALEYRVRTLAPSEAETVFPEILALEARVYEAARRDPPERLRLALDDPDGIVIITEALVDDTWRLVGASLGTPIERLRYVEGPDRDPMLGRHNTLYSLTLTVDSDHQGAGLGRMLKTAQVEVARSLRLPDGRPRYRYVAGRNRVDRAEAMTRLNRHFGAHVLAVLEHQYGTPEGRALYYRIPVGPPAPDPDGPIEAVAAGPPISGSGARRLDLASGLTRPFATPPASLREAEAHGALYGPAVNKLTLCNYVTPAAVRAVEWTGTLLPELPHLYLTSGRDECVDKSLRILRWHRKEAAVAIGLEGGYLGHTTAAARSLSDPAVHAMGPPHFAWPRVPHPADAGVHATVAAIREAITVAGGPDAVFGIFLEAVQERTGRVLPDEIWPALHALREETGVPLVLVENATACYRSGRGPFAFGGSARADLVTWWGGAQCGYIHVDGRYFVPTPLTMVSTWDGDELSLVREHHQLRAARQLDVAGAAAALDAALEPARAAGLGVKGLGLYRVLDANGNAARIHIALGQRGVLLRALPGGRLAIVPPLDAAEQAAERLGTALKEVL